MGSSRCGAWWRSPCRRTLVPRAPGDPTGRSTRALRDDELLVAIRCVCDANFQVHVRRKVWRQLRREGVVVARCTVARLMRAMGLAGAVRGRAWITTTHAQEGGLAGDRVDRQFVATRPNQLWVSDFTYVATWQGFVYVAFVIDVFARRIVGWRVSSSLAHRLRAGRARAGDLRRRARTRAAWCITATAGRSISRCATPTGWRMRASRRRSAVAAMPMTTPRRVGDRALQDGGDSPAGTVADS